MSEIPANTPPAPVITNPTLDIGKYRQTDHIDHWDVWGVRTHVRPPIERTEPFKTSDVSITTTTDLERQYQLGPIRWKRQKQGVYLNTVNKIPLYDRNPLERHPWLRQFGPFDSMEDAVAGAKQLTEKVPSTAVVSNRDGKFFSSYLLDEWRHDFNDAFSIRVEDEYKGKYPEHVVDKNTIRRHTNIDLSNGIFDNQHIPAKFTDASTITHEIVVNNPEIVALVDQKAVIPIPADTRTVTIVRPLESVNGYTPEPASGK